MLFCKCVILKSLIYIAKYLNINGSKMAPAPILGYFLIKRKTRVFPLFMGLYELIFRNTVYICVHCHILLSILLVFIVLSVFSLILVQSNIRIIGIIFTINTLSTVDKLWILSTSVH